MSGDYEIEDEIRRNCKHSDSFILYDRVCSECGDILESEVIEPGTSNRTIYVHCDFTNS